MHIPAILLPGVMGSRFKFPVKISIGIQILKGGCYGIGTLLGTIMYG